MKIIAIANSAGGVGKTTLAHCLAVSFAEFGKKTLLIDLDPAGALTFRLGFESPRVSLADFLNGLAINDSNIETTPERFDYIASDSRLVSIFPTESLSQFISSLPKVYDIVLLDLPPSLSQPFALARSVSDLILVPVRNNLHSLRGYLQVKSAAAGVVVSAIAIGDNSLIDSEELLDEVIVESAEVELASATKFSILTSAKSGDVSQSYRSAGYSILEKLGLE